MLTRSTVGGLIGYAIVRKGALWLSCNFFLYMLVYFALQAVVYSLQRELHSARFYVSIFSFLATSLFSLFIFYCYSDVFGSTFIWRSRILRLLSTSCVTVVSGSIYGTMVHVSICLSPHRTIPDLLSNAYNGTYLIPSLAAILTIHNFLLSKEITLQTELQENCKHDIGSFLRIAKVSIINALFKSIKTGCCLTLVILIAKVIMRLHYTWQQCGFDEKLTCANNNSDFYISNWLSDLGLSCLVSFFLQCQLFVMYKSLCFMMSYPVDFSILQQRISHELSSPSIETKQLEDESLLIQAMCNNSINSPKIESGKQRKSTSKLILIELQEKFTQMQSTIKRSKWLPAIVPYLGEGCCQRGGFMSLTTANNNDNINNNFAVFDILARSLALQDLCRIAHCNTESETKDNSNNEKDVDNKQWLLFLLTTQLSPSQDRNDFNLNRQCRRRNILYTNHWEHIVTVTCAMIDAAAIQIKLVDMFINGTENLFESDTSTNTPLIVEKEEDSDQNNRSNFGRVMQLRSQFHSNKNSSSKNDSNSAAAVQIDRLPYSDSKKKKEEEENNNKFKNSASQSSSTFVVTTAIYRILSMFQSTLHLLVQSVCCFIQQNAYMQDFRNTAYLFLCYMLLLPVRGGGVQAAAFLPEDAFPPACSDSVIHAVDSISLLLAAALSEDTTGYTQHSVPAIMRSILRLEIVLNAYCNITLRPSQSIIINAQGSGQKLQQRIQYRVRSDDMVPIPMRKMQQAVSYAANCIVRSYRDVLQRIVLRQDADLADQFTPELLHALERKIMESY